MGGHNGGLGNCHEECVRCGTLTLVVTHELADSVENLAEMAAIGLGVPEDTFRHAGRYGYVHFILAMTHRLKYVG